jgi:iron complex transport system permease protein
MLLIGVMVSFMSSSSMMFLMSTTTAENLHSIVFWIMGSLDEPNISLIKIVFYTSKSGLIITYLFANPLNALRLGESKAKHLGVNTTFIIRSLFVIASILTGISVSVSGVIGFVGLIIPHLLRLIIGSDYRVLLLASFLGGSIFIIASDVIARTIISPNELPIGVITGMIGGIVFISIMSKSKFNAQ